MPEDQINESASTGPLAVVVIGNDTLVEALPALPLQLAHACLAAGYDQVLPLSWGDELVAEAALRALEERRGEAAVFCACPLVRQRLLGTGSELAPMLILVPAPPAALARYVRALYGNRLGKLTYVGSCPAARSAEYDVTYSPRNFLGQLEERGIDVLAQPPVFDAILPPDRRRFASLPGGCPTPEALWLRGGQRALAPLSHDDLPVQLAQHLLEREPVLMDLAPSMGCACSGVTHATSPRSARIVVASIEPPRSPTPVIDGDIPGSAQPPDGGAGPQTPPGSPPPEFSGDAAPTDQSIDDAAGRSGPAAPGEPPEAPPDDAGRQLSSGTRPPMAVTPARALGAVAPPAAPVRPGVRPAGKRSTEVLARTPRR
ncbi:MAG TPA: hypothetical protein VLE53_06690 [Gemmatimonadaceae bacterium]|nr:hypothetical protein [Gemmatimonadaceae bacterium]